MPNFTLGTDFVRHIKKHTRIPVDLLLMINSPETKLNYFDFGAGDIVSVHAEAAVHLQVAVSEIKERERIFSSRGLRAFFRATLQTELKY